ncbi:hypothetical protein ASPTUDRAFT_78656 [Aspergillus tubingensis CBS 134.48]|uniref:Methyltransferase domain-containing protein n=1 Tax=Aspergillus tubingensis (strain CBS 134.48) TaxID=767770 RepID=A0A1L9MUD6_ASPTC|nr:hypothetical protein ASPTUDRAFT_78656 [Aspergillus tubingensis CBS 134.48]
MTTSAAEGYAFNRSWLDNVRINTMHHLVGQLYQGYIHPHICTANPEMRIADVGTGTAIWLTDLANKLPESVQLDGLDVSFDAAPCREWLPHNVTLQYWDIKSPVPEHLVGAYDLVNVRYFTIVLRNSEIKDALNNLSRLLKPGGYLQWTDTDMCSIRPVKLRPDISDEPLKRLESVLTSWVTDLGTRFQEAKFLDVDVDRRDPPHYIAQSLFDCVMVAVEVSTRNKDLDEQKAQELRGTLRDAAKASREGSYLQYTYYRVIGRKATSADEL